MIDCIQKPWLFIFSYLYYLIQVNIRHLSDCFKYAPIQTNKIVNMYAIPITVFFFGQKICVDQKLKDDFA